MADGSHRFAPSRYQTNDSIDAEIQRFYSKPVVIGTLKPFATKLGFPEWWVKRRASQLGVIVPRVKEPAWTDPENEIVTRFAARNPETIRAHLRKAGFKRTMTAIVIRRKRLGMKMCEERDLEGIYTSGAVADGLGVQQQTVVRWINLGQLKAKRRGETEAGRSAWAVQRIDLRRFLAAYPSAIDIRKVDREWFMAFAFGDML